MSDKSRRFRLRAALTGAAALLVGVGVAQAVPTSAAGTDAVVATSGNLTAAANVLPAATTYDCDTVKNGTYAALANYNSRMNVTHLNPAFDYKVYYIQKNGEIPVERSVSGQGVAVGTVLQFPQIGGDQLGRHTGWDFVARIYTINRISGEMSVNWVGSKINQPSVYRTNCDGLTSGTGHPVGVVAQRMALPFQDEVAIDESASLIPTPTEAITAKPTSPASTPEAPTSTSPETTAPETTAPETTPPSTTETTPETTPTEDPKPVLTDTLEGDGVTAGWLPGGNKVAVVDADGNELASGRVEKGSELHWHNGQLWVVGDTKVYRIMISPQDGTWKFYNDSGQNMPDFG